MSYADGVDLNRIDMASREVLGEVIHNHPNQKKKRPDVLAPDASRTLLAFEIKVGRRRLVWKRHCGRRLPRIDWYRPGW
jgi:hypothetical protein